jgi:serine/threonine-protein kinase
MNRAPAPSESGARALVGAHAGAQAPALAGRYELLLELASGGMGAVYLGRQRGAAGFERLVAVKRMHRHLTEDPALVAAFHDEARIASGIRHPNVVTVVDVYEDAGEHLIVMDYVDGASVSSLLSSARRRGMKLPRAIALRVAVEALRGLHAAHVLRTLDGRPMQIVHRDVSPQNLLLGVDGSVRVTDFGIARALERSVRTQTGELKGKVRYMSPEQATGRALDHRSDVFSLGVVLWEMLVGDKLYDAETDLELLKQASVAAISPPQLRDPTLQPELGALVMGALAVDPAARPRDAATLADQLERWSWQSGVSAKAEDVARVVEELLGERLRARRALATDILQGRRPPEIHRGHAATPASASLAGVVTSPPRRWSVATFVGVGIATVAAAASVVAFVLTGGPKAASSASASTSGSTAAPQEESVTIEVTADSAVVAVRGAGVLNVRFSGSSAHAQQRGVYLRRLQDGGFLRRCVHPQRLLRSRGWRLLLVLRLRPHWVLLLAAPRLLHRRRLLRQPRGELSVRRLRGDRALCLAARLLRRGLARRHLCGWGALQLPGVPGRAALRDRDLRARQPVRRQGGLPLQRLPLGSDLLPVHQRWGL